MALECQIVNPWGLDDVDPVEDGYTYSLTSWNFSSGYTLNSGSHRSHIFISIDDLVEQDDVRIIGSNPIVDQNGYVHNQPRTVWLKDGEVVQSGGGVPRDIEFDDYYVEIFGFSTYYSYLVEGIQTESTLIVNFDTPVRIRTIFDLAEALDVAGFTRSQPELIDMRTLAPPTIRCVNVETGNVTIDVVGPLFDGTPVEVIRIDGTPPPSRIADGNSSIFIDDAGAVRMQAATADGAPLASFFLTEHGAGGFNVNGSFFANGNREASFGGGGHTFTLDERGYTFRHNRENVTFTFEEIKRLKDLIG